MAAANLSLQNANALYNNDSTVSNAQAVEAAKALAMAQDKAKTEQAKLGDYERAASAAATAQSNAIADAAAKHTAATNAASIGQCNHRLQYEARCV